jgi:hypothetical protein
MKTNRVLKLAVLLGCLCCLVTSAQFPLHAQVQYVEGVPQCGRYEIDSQKGDFSLINACNTEVYIQWTSDGDLWGAANVAPGQRQLETTMGIPSTRGSGVISLYVCPANTSPVMPNGQAIWNRHYHGSYRCQLP